MSLEKNFKESIDFNFKDFRILNLDKFTNNELPAALKDDDLCQKIDFVDMLTKLAIRENVCELEIPNSIEAIPTHTCYETSYDQYAKNLTADGELAPPAIIAKEDILRYQSYTLAYYLIHNLRLPVFFNPDLKNKKTLSKVPSSWTREYIRSQAHPLF